MKQSKKKIFFKYIFPVLIIAVISAVMICVDIFIPSRIVLMNNGESQYELNLPSFISAQASLADNVSAVTSEMAVSVYGTSNSTFIRAAKEGEAKLTLKLFNLIAIKDVVVKVIPNTYVYAGGDAMGISIKSEGLVIVDFTEIKDENNSKCNPAIDAGLKKGDMILKCNNEPVRDSDIFAEIVKNSAGSNLDLLCIRDGVTFNINVKPVFSPEDSIYRAGMWVRDGTDGIGTLTFVDKITHIYGAIGHGINDSDLNMLYSVGSGSAIRAKIIDVKIGKSGNPGELKGVFIDVNNPFGDVRVNCSTGVYGKYYTVDDEEPKDKQLMGIGMSYEIQPGKATILTTLGDDGVKEYDIEIKKIYKNKINSPKSMVIKVTDEELIKRTGGIVQGMSGSPIIQNGKIIGAVTHVLVNDSTMGYGIFIESMLNNIDYVSKYKNALAG